MASELAGKWLGWWQPLTGGMTPWGLANGLLLSGGWFWVRVRGGYLLYRGAGTRAATDYSRPVGAAAYGATEIRQYIWVETAAGSYWYTARGVGPGGLEAGAPPGAMGLVIDAAGEVSGGLPGDVERAWAEPLAGGRIVVRWRYSPVYETDRPTEFRIYHDNGTGQMDWVRPIGVVGWDLRRSAYSWTSGPYADGVRVRFGVRAASEAGEGLGAEAAAAADASVLGWPAAIQVETTAGEVADAE